MSLAIRAVHVVAAAFAVGAPVALFMVVRAGPASDLVEGLVRSVERTHWVALATLVATGVGNLGALGEAISDPGTGWGQTFLAKMGFVLLLLVVSAVRTFVIAGQSMATVAPNRLAAWYGVTGVAGMAVLLLAVVLAHG